MGFKVPKSRAENPAGGNDTPLAPGLYQGVIAEVETLSLPNANGTVFAGYESADPDDGEMLNVYIRNNEPLEGQAAVGNRVTFAKFCIRDGEHTVETVDTEAREVAHWQLQRSAAMLANLAAALGWTAEDGDSVVVKDGFIEALKSGVLQSTPIRYSIRHRRFKYKEPHPKAGQTGIEEQISGFASA